MKTLVSVIVAFFMLSFCTASCSKDGNKTPAQNNSESNSNPSTTKMKITIGAAIFTATLYDNPNATAFKSKLPLAIDMKELNGNEKYFDLQSPLSRNESLGGNIKNGDLALYGTNTLVVFYKNFTTSYSYTKLGYVDNPTGLAAALGTGNRIVKFENN